MTNQRFFKNTQRGFDKENNEMRENRHDPLCRPRLLDKNEETSTIGALQTQFYNLTGFI